jgi:transcriptional regulator with XRE-family HTH domain
MAAHALIIRPALKAFAQELKAARLHAGMSRERLARHAGMTRQGILKIENGGNVTLGTIVLLANALGCEVADLFPTKR